MDIEQFKMIIELAEKAGKGAFTIALIYMIMPLVLSIVKWGAVILIVKIIFGKIAGFISHLTFASSVKETLGIVGEFMPARASRQILEVIADAKKDRKLPSNF